MAEVNDVETARVEALAHDDPGVNRLLIVFLQPYGHCDRVLRGRLHQDVVAS
jgi:hypothetical protein